MFGGWRALRESLVRSVRTLAAHIQFAELRKRSAVLLRFNDVLGLIDHLTQRDGDLLDEKDHIYAALVEAVQAQAGNASLASTLLFLGLWPGLDAIYRQRLRSFPNDPGELVAQIAAQFTAAVHRLRVHHVKRTAATLVLNTGRLVVYRAERAAREKSSCGEMPDEHILADHRDATDAGAGERQIADLRARLTAIVGERDGDLLIATEVEDETQRAFARRLGLTEGMVRKRHQRALKKLRRRCPTSRSWAAFTGRRARVPPGDEP